MDVVHHRDRLEVAADRGLAEREAADHGMRGRVELIDDGLLVAVREGDYKYVFSEQRKEGTMGVWAEPFTTLRLQKIFNLMQDPYERADITSNTFWDWQINHVGSMYGVMDDVFKFAATFKDYPPRSSPPSFNPANVMEDTVHTIKAKQKLYAAFPMLHGEEGKAKE